MIPRMDTNAVCQGIIEGKADDALDRIADALRARMKIVRNTKALSVKAGLNPGQKVRLKGITPKYLNGLVGTVEPATRGGTRVAVRFPQGTTGTFSNPMVVPAGCLEVVS